MNKYIDANLLRERIKKNKYVLEPMFVKGDDSYYEGETDGYNCILSIIDSLQQDDTQVDKMLCSQVWWEEQGWIMIPPDATIEGIDSLLKQVRKKLQQEQTEVNFKSEERKWVYNAVDNIFPEDGDFMSEVDFRKIIKATARHFYELGLNARKEE